MSLHETIHLTCDVEANPAQVAFQWRFQSNSDLLSFNQINDTRYAVIQSVGLLLLLFGPK